MLPLESEVWDVTVVIVSGIENTYELSFDDPTQTKPACKVSVGVFEDVVTSKETVACAEVLDFGTYPIGSYLFFNLFT